MTNFELLNQMYNDYFRVDMKKKKDDEIEMLATRPTEALPPMPPLTEKQLRAENNDRVQTCERALCGVLDRLDAIEARIQSHDNDITELLHEAVAPSGHREDHSEISGRLDIIEKKLFLISEFYEKRSEHKHTIWESLEHKGLAERCEGTLVLTMKGRQVASLFDNGEIEDIRE